MYHIEYYQSSYFIYPILDRLILSPYVVNIWLLQSVLLIFLFKESSGAYDIKDYCKNLYLATEVTPGDDQVHGDTSTELSIDQQQPGNNI